jgi:hypothetical protein
LKQDGAFYKHLAGGGYIERVCEVSAQYCLKCETDAKASAAKRAASDTEAQRRGSLASALPATVKQALSPNRRRRRRDTLIDPLIEVKAIARKLKAEGASEKQVCKRLGTMPRPVTARWAHLSWNDAYADQKYRPSVQKWLWKHCAAKH